MRHSLLLLLLVILPGCSGKKEYEPPVSSPPVVTSGYLDTTASVDGQVLSAASPLRLKLQTEYAISGELRLEDPTAETPGVVLELLVNHDGRAVTVETALLDETRGDDGRVAFEGTITTPENEGEVELRITVPNEERRGERLTILSSVVELEAKGN